MFGRETFIVCVAERIAEDAMAPRVRAGDYVWIDPDSLRRTAAWSRSAILRVAGRPSSGASSSATGADQRSRTAVPFAVTMSMDRLPPPRCS